MTVTVKVNLPSGTIILNRPDKRNALTRQMIADLVQAFDDLHGERRVRAVILTGSGPAFCAGMDLAEMQETSQQPDALNQWHEDAVIYRELIDKMLLFPKPIIAAVNGPAVAGGAGLVLASDIVIGSPEAKFAFPEPRRGIVAGMVSPLLVFRIGASQAACC
jgi:enoyl-CoA hydratase/carnithine racemase